MVEIRGDTHVHVPHIGNGTSKAVKAAINKDLDFVVFAYHSHTERFDEFLKNPNLGPGYEVKDMGSIAKIIHNDKVFYAIKGEQITADIDLIAWPVKEEIEPNGRDLEEICLELRKQGAIIVLPHPRRDRLDYIGKILPYIDAVEYNCAPEPFVKRSNKLAEGLARHHKLPLIAGSDARLSKGIMPCTKLKGDSEIFKGFEKPEQLTFYLRNKIKNEAEIQRIHSSVPDFLYQYAIYASAALMKDPKGVVRSFVRSHL